jgi:hypothetical protein
MVKKVLCLMFIIAIGMAAVGCSNQAAPEPTSSSIEPAPVAPVTPAPAVAPPTARTPAPAVSAAPAKRALDQAPARTAPSLPKTVQVPAGTEVTVLLIDSISTGKNEPGDQFMASIADPIVVDGQTVIGRGAKVMGRIVDAESAGRVKGKANMRIVLTGILNGGQTYPIVTRPFIAEAEATKGRDAGIIGGAAGIGAAIGAIAGGKGGAGKGAVIGGAAGTGTVLATKGKEVEFDSETKLKFTLDKSADLPIIGSKTS